MSAEIFTSSSKLFKEFLLQKFFQTSPKITGNSPQTCPKFPRWLKSPLVDHYYFLKWSPIHFQEFFKCFQNLSWCSCWSSPVVHKDIPEHLQKFHRNTSRKYPTNYRKVLQKLSTNSFQFYKISQEFSIKTSGFSRTKIPKLWAATDGYSQSEGCSEELLAVFWGFL